MRYLELARPVAGLFSLGNLRRTAGAALNRQSGLKSQADRAESSAILKRSVQQWADTATLSRFRKR
jgi:hypothetical protein